MKKQRLDQKKALSIFRKILIAKRNKHIHKEQTAYEELLKFCNTNNYNFENIFYGCAEHFTKKASIADIMNGLRTEAKLIYDEKPKNLV